MQQPNKHIRHLKNDRLETIKPDYRGNKIIKGKFANGEELYLPEFSKVLKWQLSPNPQRDEKKQDTYTPPVQQGCDFITSDEDMVVWLGHATFFIRLNGISFITDPVLFNLPLVKRKTQLPCPPDQLLNIDFMLLSHAHRDHLDKQSIKTVFTHNPQLIALIPLEVGKILRNTCRHLPYQEAGWFQKYDLVPDAVEVYFLPASHWHRRGLTDMNKMLWGSFLLKTPEITLYFAGDSGIDSHFEEIEDLFGPIDLCIMPVGAYKPSFLMKKSHMNPHEAVRAFNTLRGGTFIPMHYGTFDLSDEPPSEPVRMLEQIAASGMLPGLKMPAIGEPVLLKDLQ
ncbi:L-ascorbate metabolism protein UlaG (beta-lactamase superfamily) [Pontibacter aydingkolensis]|uniref:MBL fold metallo-hydrolase n=1 Tax=Pontibacter aydingkolensis TaxID=1911536 RepID=A0ABS7CYQ9_9BACT|nr:MBL fold metallo-hydrolase [Pontibacter aydingkolensis]MBW7468900.1 MBL fold metallo-hydrolase [Pontibacter aydingkolensis]